MTDRELLEMAAKAAGMLEGKDIDWRKNENGTWTHILDCEGRRWEIWNPLEDDGDAFRLSVKLNLQIERSKRADRAYVGLVGEASRVEYVNDQQDIYSCTRRAIVRAAAEIGRSMP